MVTLSTGILRGAGRGVGMGGGCVCVGGGGGQEVYTDNLYLEKVSQ